MKIVLGVLCFGSLLIAGHVKANKESETLEATGEMAVSDVLQRFNDTGLETNETTLLFMRRMAWVESNFGNSPYTFRQGFHGGIWQKDLKAFRDTQNVKKFPILLEKHRLIEELLNVTWIKTPWRELRKPLHSVLTAWLFLCILPREIPPTVEEQAEFWVEFKDECAPMAQDFIDGVKVLEGKFIVLTFILNSCQATELSSQQFFEP